MSRGEPSENRERRRVTSLFGDLRGYTAVTEVNDPEDVAEVVTELFERFRIVIEEHGGRMPQTMGDGFLALFGTPRAREDDAERALDCALALRDIAHAAQDEIAERLGTELPMRIGVSTGTVVVGRPTDPDADIPITGDSVNVAARLEALAPAGGILVSQTTRDLAADRFVWESAHTYNLKNRAEPVVAHHLVGRATIGLRSRRRDGDLFVGRTNELSELAAIWAQVMREGAGITVVQGSAGIGKSRLVHEFIRRLGERGAAPRVALGSSPPRGSGPLDALRDLVVGCLTDEHMVDRDLPPEASASADALISTVEDAPRPVRRPSAFVDGLASFLRAWAGDEPAVIVLEDAQWSDASTLRVLARLAGRLRDRPIAFVVVHRAPGRTLPRQVRRRAAFVEVGPFSNEENEALLDHLLSGAGDDDRSLRSTIVSKSEGNPLFTEEIVRLIAKRSAGGVIGEGSADLESVPDTVEQIFLAQLDEVEPQSRQLAQEAAVVGRRFADDLLASVSESTTKVDAALRRLENGNLIRYWDTGESEHGHEFIHYLNWNTIYESLLVRRRAELHLRTALAIEKMYPDRLAQYAETLAMHYQLGGREDLAVRYYVHAGEKSAAVHATPEAKSFRRRASRVSGMTSSWLSGITNVDRRPIATLAALAVQCVVGLAVVAPTLAFLFSLKPPADQRWLGLPAAFTALDVSSIVLPFVIGAVPVFVGCLAFANVRAPRLLSTPPRRREILRDVVVLWVLVIASALAVVSVLYVFVRQRMLGSTLEVYFVSVARRFILDDRRLTLGGAVLASLFVAVVFVGWTTWRADRWRTYLGRRHQMGRLAADPADRHLFAQLGRLVLLGAGLLTTSLVLALAGWLPSATVGGPGMAHALSALLAVVFMLVIAAGLWSYSRRLGSWSAFRRRIGSLFARPRRRMTSGVRRPGGIGFEVPLVLATIFGIAIVTLVRDDTVSSLNSTGPVPALADTDRLVRWFPESAYAYTLRGGSRLESDDGTVAEAAVDDFETALALDSNLALVHVFLIKVYWTDGRLDEAERSADRLVALEPEHPTSYLSRAIVNAFRGDTVAFAADLLTTVSPELSSRTWDAENSRCSAFMALRRHAEALERCTAAAEANSSLYDDRMFQAQLISLSRWTDQEDRVVDVLVAHGVPRLDVDAMLSALGPNDFRVEFGSAGLAFSELGGWYDRPGFRDVAIEHRIQQGLTATLTDNRSTNDVEVTGAIQFINLYSDEIGAQLGFEFLSDPERYRALRVAPTFPLFSPDIEYSIEPDSRVAERPDRARFSVEVTNSLGRHVEEVVVERDGLTVSMYVVVDDAGVEIDEVVGIGRRRIARYLADR